jgi:hypothetical protein
MKLGFVSGQRSVPAGSMATLLGLSSVALFFDEGTARTLTDTARTAAE